MRSSNLVLETDPLIEDQLPNSIIPPQCPTRLWAKEEIGLLPGTVNTGAIRTPTPNNTGLRIGPKIINPNANVVTLPGEDHLLADWLPPSHINTRGDIGTRAVVVDVTTFLTTSVRRLETVTTLHKWWSRPP